MPLTGLVLHASRCGSTLLLRALASWPGVVGVDEPPELDAALARARRGLGEEALHEVLTRLGERGERVLVKTDAWHVLELERLVAAAAVPWVLVHRDPAEILVSHRRQPGSHTVPGLLDPIWLGPPRTHLPALHAPVVLARLYAAAAAHVVPGALVDFADLPADLPRIAARFGLDPGAVAEDCLRDVLAVHAKRPHEPYQDDRADKQAAVDADLAALVAARVRPSYDALLVAGARTAA